MAELKEGLDIRVNTTVAGDQVNPRIVSNSEATVVVWEHQGDQPGIYAQLYDTAGNPVGDEQMVATGGALRNPIVAVAGDGSFVISWQDAASDNRVSLQRFDSAGNPVGNPVETSLTGVIGEGAIALDGQGNVLLVRAQGNGANATITAQKYNSQNELTENFPVNTEGVNASNPAIAMAANGNYVITWQQITPGNQQGGGLNVMARRYSPDGPIDDTAFQVNTTGQANQQNPKIAIAPDGSTFSISWESGGGNAFGGLYAQSYEFNPLEPLGGEINLDPGINADTKAIAIGADGTLAIAYAADNGGGGNDIFLRYYDAAGTLLNPNDVAPVNSYTQGNQASPAIALNNAGNITIVWQSQDQDTSGYGIYARGLSAGVSEEEPEEPDVELPEFVITPLGENLEVKEGESRPLYEIVLSGPPTADVTISFQTGDDIEPLEPLTFTPENWDQPQTVTVTAIADEIDQGDRTIEIRPQVTSEDPNYNERELDSFSARIIDIPPVVVEPEPGEISFIQPVGSTHVLQGFLEGADFFKISLSRQPTDTVTITAELPSSILNMANVFPGEDLTSVDFSTNTYTIEITPDNWDFSHSIMVNAPEDPALTGMRGQSRIREFALEYQVTSNDPGYNGLPLEPFTLNFTPTSNRGMEATLNEATVIGLTEIDDRITGSASNDVIYGGPGNDVIQGIGGDNIIYGQEGNDGIVGGDGNDVIFGGEGDDILIGGAGDDILFGGAGNDRLYGGDGNDVLFGDEGNNRLFGGAGRDTLTGGPGNNSFGIGPGTGGNSIPETNVITDFIKGKDILEFVGEFNFARLEIFQGTDAYAADTILRDRETGEYLALLQNVTATSLDPLDFV